MNPKIFATGNEALNGEFNISYYIFEKDGEIGEDKCTSQGCGKCYNSCIPWEVEIRVSCPAPTEAFECECIDHKCVKV